MGSKQTLHDHFYESIQCSTSKSREAKLITTTCPRTKRDWLQPTIDPGQPLALQISPTQEIEQTQYIVFATNIQALKLVHIHAGQNSTHSDTLKYTVGIFLIS